MAERTPNVNPSHPFLESIRLAQDGLAQDGSVQDGSAQDVPRRIAEEVQLAADYHRSPHADHPALRAWPVLGLYSDFNPEIFAASLQHLQSIAVAHPSTPEEFLLCEAAAEYAEKLHRAQLASPLSKKQLKHLEKLRFQVYNRLLNNKPVEKLQDLPEGDFDEVLNAYQQMVGTGTMSKEPQEPVKEGKPSRLTNYSWDPYKKKSVEELKDIIRAVDPGNPCEHDKFVPHLVTAELIWREAQSFTTSMADEEKMEVFRERWPDFLKSFPVVSKYMILLRNYNCMAFKKMLMKLATPPKTTAERMQIDPKERWCELRADYVGYLFESQQRNHNRKAVQAMRASALKNIRKEFMSFEKEYDDTQKQIAADEKKYKKELLSELMGKAVDEAAVIEGDGIDIDGMLEELETLHNQQLYAKVLEQFQENRRPSPPCCSGFGRNAASSYESDLKLHGKNSKYKQVLVN